MFQKMLQGGSGGEKANEINLNVSTPSSKGWHILHKINPTKVGTYKILFKAYTPSPNTSNALAAVLNENRNFIDYGTVSSYGYAYFMGEITTTSMSDTIDIMVYNIDTSARNYQITGEYEQIS